MGSYFEISILDSDERSANEKIDKAIDEVIRVEKLISSWSKNSQTTLINLYAGAASVEVEVELYELIQRSILISEKTDGAFDISFASINKYWSFDESMTSLPDKDSLQKSVEKINYKNIDLNRKAQTVYLKEEGMKIGFGAIGKGYAADCAKKILQDLQVENGMVNAGGDITCWGSNPKGKNWRIGITNPHQKDAFIGYVDVTNKSVVTSGDYERYIYIDGVRYSHIINPRTGYPCTGVSSVTVITDSAERADALATGIFVLGINKGMSLVKKMDDIEVIMVDDRGKIYASSNANLIPLSD